MMYFALPKNKSQIERKMKMWSNVNLKANGYSWETCKIRLYYRFDSFQTCRSSDAIWVIKDF